MLFISNFQDDGGVTTVFSSASKYEVHPEDVAINFSDVRGVMKIVFVLF